MKSHWRKPLVITPLLIAALLICMAGFARAGSVIGLQIQFPTSSSPFQYARPGGTVAVTARVTVDATDYVWMRATIGASTSAYVKVGQVVVPAGLSSASRDFSVSVTLSGSESEGAKNVTVEVYTDGDATVRGNTETNAVYVDATPPVVTLGSLPTTPTTNPRPTWTWSGSDALSGLDYYIITLDGELPFQTAGTASASFTPSSNLADGAHVLKVKAVDKAGNVGTEQSFSAVTIDTAPPAAPSIAALAAGHNTSPIAIDWNDVTDGTNAITYVLQYAGNAGFSGAISKTPSASAYSFDAATAGEGEYWFRVKTISTVRPSETKESGWSAIVSTVYDKTGPAAPELTRETPSPTNQSPQTWSWSAPADATGYMVSDDGVSTWINIYNVNTYQTTFSASGTYSFAVAAYDWLGNVDVVGKSATGTVTVDVTPPDAPTGLTVTTPTVDKTPTWSWTAVGDAAGYEVRLDGAIIRDVATAISYTHSEELGDGAHTIEVRSYDALGNKSGWCAAVTVMVDITAPEVPGMPVAEADPTSDNTPKWTWPAIQNAAGDFAHYNVYEDGVKVAEVTDPEYTSGTLADGLHVLEVTSVDDLGNESAKSTAGHVVTDTVAPAVPHMAPVAAYTKEYDMTFAWSAVADAVKYDLEYTIGSAGPVTVLDILLPDYNLDLLGATHGDVVKARVMAYDAAGNTSAFSGYAETIIDRVPPTVAFIAQPLSPTINSRPVWVWDGDGTGSPIDHYGVALDTEASFDTMDIQYRPSSALTPGSHTLYIGAFDAAGNRNATVVSHTVFIDTIPPAAPVMNPLAAGYNTPFTVSWAAVTDGVNTITYEVQWATSKGFGGAATLAPQAALTVDIGPSFDGEYWFRVRTISTVRPGETKLSEWSLPVSTIYDTTPPAAPVLVLETPNPTNATPQTWSWSTPAGAVGYMVSVDGGLTFINIGNVNTYQTTFSTSGTHSFAVLAYDWLANMNLANAATGYVTVDVTPPDAPTNLATSPARINYPNPVWTWMASVGDVASYEARLDGGAPVNVGLVMTYTASNVGEGVHWLEVRALDALGNPSGWAGPVPVTVDMTAPAVPTAPWTTSPTFSTTQDWSWEPVDDPYPDRYDVRVNGGPAVDVALATTYQTNLGSGVHYLQVRAVDDVGNISAWSERGYVTVDTTNPVKPIMAALPPYTNKNTARFVWSAVVDAIRYELQYSINGTLAQPVGPILLQAFELDISGCVDGDVIRAVVRAYDAAGNAGDWSNGVQTTIDRTAPTVTINTITTPTNDATPEWSWTVEASEGYAPVDHYLVSLDLWPAFETVSASYHASSPMEDGDHTLTVIAVDQAGNQSQPATSAVTIDTTASVPGMPATTSPTNNTTPTWTWAEVSDPDFGYYNVYADGVKVVFAPGAEPKTGTYTSEPLADGLHSLEVTSVDKLGNESARSTQGHVLIDTKAPAKPAMNPMAQHSKLGMITFSWSASSDDLAVRYRFQYSLTGGAPWTTIHNLSTQSYTVDATSALDGVVVAGRVMAIDAVDNESAYSVLVSTTIDAVAPVVSAVSPTAPVRDNDATPTWTWSGSDNLSGVSHYIVTLDSELPTRIEYRDGETSFTPSSNLVDGVHTLVVQGVDNVGNEGTPYAFEPVTIDTTAPEAPGMPVPEEDPTSDDTPKWTWPAIQNAAGDFDHYNVYEDGAFKTTATTTEYTSGTLADGLHVLEVTSVDNLGNEGAKSTAGHVVIDLEKPTVPELDPMPEWMRPEDLQFSWSAASDDLAVVYEFRYLGAAAEGLGMFFVTMPGLASQSIDIGGNPTLLSGEWTVTATVRATDAVGNVSDWSPEVTVKTDITPPTVAFTEEPSGTTNNPRPTWAWLGEDARSGVDHYIVKLDDEPSFITDDKMWTPASNLADGEHKLSVMVVDAVGLASGWLESAAVTIDTTPPAAPGMPVTVSPTNDTTPTWTWTGVSDPDFDHYNVYEDGVKVAEVTDPIYTSAPLADGLHSLEVTSVDKLGNESAKSTQGHVLIDTKAPAKPAMNPMTQYSKRGNITFSWSASDDDLETRYRFQYSLTGGAPWTTVYGLQGQSYIVDASGASDGAVVAGRVMAIDAVGNQSAYSLPVSTIIDGTAPEVIADDPTTPQITRNARPTWAWHGNDDFENQAQELIVGSGVAYYMVTLDGEWTLNTVSGSFTPASNLADGDHVLRVAAVDNVGNVGEDTIFEPVTIDTTAPEVPGMPVPEADPTSDNTPKWTWPAIADAAGDFDHYNVYEDGVKVVFSQGAEPKIGTYTSEPLTDGLHVLEVTSVDKLGNESARSTQGHVLIDTGKPAAPVMNPMPAFSKPGMITFSWSVSDDLLEVKYNFQYSLDGGTTWEPMVTGLTVQSYTVDASALTDGTVVVGRAMVYDAVGNESAYSASVSTTIDGAGPIITLGTLPTTPTRNPRPTWTWSGTDALSGLDYYVVTLDGEPPIMTEGKSYTPASDLPDGEHILKVHGVDKLGNVGEEESFEAVLIDTTPPPVPGVPTTTSPTRNQTPPWTWNPRHDMNEQGEEPASYNVYLDDEFLANVTTNAFSEEDYETYQVGPLPERTHHLQVTAVDWLGNESARSATGHVMIDLSAPAAPVMAALPDYTNANSLTFVWSWVGDGMKYDLEYQIGAVEPVVVPGILVQEYTVNISGAGSGTVISAKVRGYDAVGNVTEYSDSVSTTVDRTGPVVTLGTLPGSPRRDRRPTWTWSGEDAMSGLDYFVVTLDGEPPIMTEGKSYTPASDLPDGEHILKVYGVDNLGNVGDEKSFAAVTIDTTPPAIPGIPRTTSPTRNTSPVWVWAPSGQDAVSYNIYLDDESIAYVHEPTYTTEGLSEGTHHLQVTAVDWLGNESDMSATGHVVIDLTAPAAPAAPIPDVNPTNQASQLWRWDYVEDAATFDVQTSEDGETWSEPISVGNVLTFTTGFAGDGITGRLRVRAIDALGNVGDWSAAGSVYVDTVAPSAPTGLTLDPEGVRIGEALYTADATPKVKWNGPEDAAHYDVWLDGKYWISTENTEYEFTEGLPDGQHAVKVASVDALGNSDGYSAELVFVVDTTPPEAPGMPRTESPTANRKPTWTWNATSGAATYRVFLDGVAQPAGQPNGTPQPGTTFTPAADLADGWHDLQVTAIDALGNESAKSAAGSVLVDATAPAVPDIAHLPTHTKATQVMFRWSSIGDVAGYDFSYIVGDGEEWTTIEGITTQSYVVKGPDGRDLLDGEVVQGRVRAYDSLRNTSSWSEVASTTIDLTGPVVSITSPAAAKNTNLSTFTWTWTGNDGERGSGVQGYWVKLNDEAWSWTKEPVFTPTRLHSGANVLRVKGVDNLGNEGAVSEAPAVTLVDAAIFDLMPAPGEHPINEASTIVFSVAGLYDGRVEVLLSNKPIEDAWRLVTIVNTSALAKFYVLLDDAVMQPGPLTVTIKIGDVTRFCDYEVLDERSGFGFGRLRPW